MFATADDSLPADAWGPQVNYSDKMFDDMWNDLCPGFYNYGRISPDADVDTIPDLIQANEDMVQFIVSQMGICKDSTVLDLGCGKGMYTVRIAEITGCRFTGVDLNLRYIEEECTKLAVSHGVSEQGEFVHSSMADLPSRIREQKYTHILSLGAMLYVHDKLDALLDNVVSCSNKVTKIFLWDMVRSVDWSECSEIVQRHIKVEFPLLSKEEVLEKIEHSQLQLTGFEDVTQHAIPSLKIVERECRKRDPELKYLTYPFWGKLIMDGKVSYVIYYLKLE